MLLRNSVRFGGKTTHGEVRTGTPSIHQAIDVLELVQTAG